MQQAVVTDPVTYSDIVLPSEKALETA
jgi:hypothetical protein